MSAWHDTVRHRWSENQLKLLTCRRVVGSGYPSGAGVLAPSTLAALKNAAKPGTPRCRGRSTHRHGMCYAVIDVDLLVDGSHTLVKIQPRERDVGVGAADQRG
jgi:hypothetical protein